MGFRTTTAAVLMTAAPFVAGSAANAAPSTCWWIPGDGEEETYEGKDCDVSFRVLPNGMKVWEIGGNWVRTRVAFYEDNRFDLWAGDTLTESRYWGTHHFDEDGDVRLDMGDGDQLAFRFPQSELDIAAGRTPGAPQTIPIGRGLRRGQLSETPFEF